MSPGAWLVNFSNPSGIVAEALLNHSKVKTFGLCNRFVNMRANIVKTIGVNDFDYDYVGLNHLSWITRISEGGKSYLEELGRSANSRLKNIPGVEYDDELFDAVPAIPSSYLSYFYTRDEQLEKRKKAEKSRGEICADLENPFLKSTEIPIFRLSPPELAERGGALYSTAAVSAVDAIENNKNEYHVVNVKNAGALPFLEDSNMVEIKCRLNREGAHSSSPGRRFLPGKSPPGRNA